MLQTLRDHQLYAKLSKYEFYLKNGFYKAFYIFRGDVYRPEKGWSYIEMEKAYKCDENL